MKNFILTAFITLGILTTYSQSVAINADASLPNASAILDIKSVNKGLLIPRMTTVQRTAIITPAVGLIVFDITTNGLWFYNGTVWNVLSSGSSTNYWSATGNDIYNNNTGNVGIGTTAPFAYGHGGNNKIAEISNLNTGSNIQSHLILSTNGNSGAAGGITWASQSVPGAEKRLGFIGDAYETSNAARMLFYTRDEAGTLGERLTVLGNGNAGIGLSTPLAKLHIAGNVKIDGTNTMEFGAGIAGKDASAGKIGYQTYSTFDALDIVGAGTSGSNRKIRFWNEGGAEFKGSVAVGVTDPLSIYKMDIADRIRIRSSSASSTAGIALNNSNNSQVSAFIGTKDLDLAGIYGSVSGWGLLMNTNTGAVAIGYQNPVAGYRLSVLGNQYIDGLIKTTGGAEIAGAAQITGAANVGADMHVGGTIFATNVNFLKFMGHFIKYSDLGQLEYNNEYGISSIVASYDVSASGFNAFSDARIKNIRGKSNSAKDLQTINALQITDYTMKDEINYGNKPFKKVIAQEVEKEYPQVVSKHTDYIPNVYQITNKIEKTANGYNFHFASKHNLSLTAKKVRVQLKDGEATKDFDIVSIPSDNTVEIKANDLKADKIFVYGEQVNDFRTVDYEGLTTLNISATQELSKLLITQQSAIEAQDKKIDMLLKEIELLKEKKYTVLGTKK